MTEDASGSDSPRPFDEILQELEGVVSRLEQGDLPLEESLAAFERGVILTREGERILASAEQRVERLLSDREGEPEVAPLSGPAQEDA
jgi:exodeoxyribonuclease VII small subunit